VSTSDTITTPPNSRSPSGGAHRTTLGSPSRRSAERAWPRPQRPHPRGRVAAHHGSLSARGLRREPVGTAS
jgi:hypothetical protein